MSRIKVLASPSKISFEDYIANKNQNIQKLEILYNSIFSLDNVNGWCEIPVIIRPVFMALCWLQNLRFSFLFLLSSVAI